MARLQTNQEKVERVIRSGRKRVRTYCGEGRPASPMAWLVLCAGLFLAGAAVAADAPRLAVYARPEAVKAGETVALHVLLRGPGADLGRVERVGEAAGLQPLFPPGGPFPPEIATHRGPGELHLVFRFRAMAGARSASLPGVRIVLSDKILSTWPVAVEILPEGAPSAGHPEPASSSENPPALAGFPGEGPSGVNAPPRSPSTSPGAASPAATGLAEPAPEEAAPGGAAAEAGPGEGGGSGAPSPAEAQPPLPGEETLHEGFWLFLAVLAGAACAFPLYRLLRRRDS